MRDVGCCRPVGRLTFPYAAFPGEQGLTTDEQDVRLLLVFSEPVTGLTVSSFSVSGPSGAYVSHLQLLRGTKTFYHLVVSLPGVYYVSATVSLVVGAFRICISNVVVLPELLCHMSSRSECVQTFDFPCHLLY